MPPAAHDDFNPRSHDAMFAVILSRLDAVIVRLDDGSKRMDAQDTVLARIEVQALKTNGRVTAAEGAIKATEAGVKEALTKACPGKCTVLEDKVRSLEDSRITQDAALGGARWTFGILWAAGTVTCSIAIWWLSRP